MSLVAKSGSDSRFYCNMETGDVFEECADGLFALKRIDGKKERIQVAEIPSDAQLLFGNAHRIWDYVR